MIKTKQISIIDVDDWDKLVTKTYGRQYAFQQQDDCKSRGICYINVPVQNPYDYENDTVPEVVNHDKMGVSFKAWLERNPEQLLPNEQESWSLILWWHRNFYPHVDMIINDLYEKGLIEAGKYGINIDW